MTCTMPSHLTSAQLALPSGPRFSSLTCHVVWCDHEEWRMQLLNFATSCSTTEACYNVLSLAPCLLAVPFMTVAYMCLIVWYMV